MYIGAWTEYRLAQEQLLNRRRLNSGNDVSRRQLFAGSAGGIRRGVGIYHPSLAEKGGTEVSALPDRESFRRSLESALSSNLAADDVEHISRVLEPLMQRLPAIDSVAYNRQESVASGTSLNRRRLHRCVRRRRARTRIGATADQVRSDAGTRMISEGTNSTRSGFSAASAPAGSTTGSTAFKAGVVPRRRGYCDVNCRGIAREDGWDARSRTRAGGKPTVGVPPLPILVHSRQANPGTLTTLGLDTCSHAAAKLKTVAAGAWDTSTTPAPAQQVGSDICARCWAHDGPSVSEAVALARCEDSKPESGVQVGGGYDSGKATVILRAVRRRDPKVLKADFQQFWTWKRNGVAARPPGDSPSSKDRRSTISCAAIARSRAQDPCNAKRIDIGARKRAYAERSLGDRNPKNVSVIAAKVEALERMKEVYLSKGARKGHIINVGGGDTATKLPACIERERIGLMVGLIPAKADGLSAGVSSREPQANAGGMTGSTSSDSRDQVRGLSEEGRASQSGDSDKMNGSRNDVDDAVVVVPDLELTESRIRLVEKYFGGVFRCSGGGRRERHPLASFEEGDVAERRSAGSNRSKYAGDHDEDMSGNFEKTATSEDDDGKQQRWCTSVGNVGGANYNGGEWNDANCEARMGKPLHITNAESPRHQGATVADPPKALLQQERKLLGSTCRNPSGGRGSGVWGEICKDNSASSAADTQNKLERNRFGAGETKPHTPVPGEAASPCACVSTGGAPLQAPPCSRNCSTSLEDLVCWTKGLDFEAAIEGF